MIQNSVAARKKKQQKRETIVYIKRNSFDINVIWKSMQDFYVTKSVSNFQIDCSIKREEKDLL